MPTSASSVSGFPSITPRLAKKSRNADATSMSPNPRSSHRYAPTPQRSIRVTCSPDGNGSSVKEIVRQQWNFGPPSSIREVEEYRVELSSVAVLELIIKPNISGGAARASLKNLRLS